MTTTVTSYILRVVREKNLALRAWSKDCSIFGTLAKRYMIFDDSLIPTNYHINYHAVITVIDYPEELNVNDS